MLRYGSIVVIPIIAFAAGIWWLQQQAVLPALTWAAATGGGLAAEALMPDIVRHLLASVK